VDTKKRVGRWLLIGVVLSVAAVILVAPAGALAADHLVTQITLTTPTPNVLQLNDQVTFSFNYNTTEAGGVRIFMRPFTNGALTPNYGAHGSGVYPVGSGSGSGFFTITSGNAVVDQIRIQMLNASQTTVLYEGFIPVHYRFTSAPSNVVTKLVMTRTPNVLKLKQKAKVSFSYKTNKAAGMRILVRPLTNGRPTAHAAAKVSPLYPVGTGTSSTWFTVTSGATTVTAVRVQMWNANRTKKLFQATVPVSYRFAKPANVTNSIALTPRTPNVLRYGENISLAFKYTTNVAGGVRIFARPMTNGSLTPNYAAHPSGIYPVGSGSAGGWFTITGGALTTVVDRIRIQMYNADQSRLLYQVQLPVSYQYK
jgi:hypothetical protein